MKRIILLLFAASSAFAQTSAYPMPQPEFTQVLNNVPLVGGFLCSFSAGTTTPLTSYTDASAGTPNTNPVVLNTNGQASVWIAPAVGYKFILYSGGNGACPGTGAVLWSQDNIYAQTQGVSTFNGANGTVQLLVQSGSGLGITGSSGTFTLSLVQCIETTCTPTFATLTTTGGVTVGGNLTITGSCSGCVSVTSQTTPSLSLNTVYQNTGTSPLFVSASVTGGTNTSFLAYAGASNPPTSSPVSATNINVTSGVGVQQIFFIVLPNYYFEIAQTFGGGGAIQSLTEWH